MPSRKRPRSGADEPKARPPGGGKRVVEFLPEVLDHTVIAIPLFREFEKYPRKLFPIIIDLNLEYRHDGARGARLQVEKLIAEIVRKRRGQGVRDGQLTDDGVHVPQYVFATLDADAIRELVQRDSRPRGTLRESKDRAIYHVWPDFALKRLINASVRTVKADAAHNAFAAFGHDIVWAIVDSGIDGTHPHFAEHANLDLPEPLAHRDFTVRNGNPLRDAFGHGTHVAGIVAGAMTGGTIIAATRFCDEHERPKDFTYELESIAGMAPRCKLMSLKVMDKAPDGAREGDGAVGATSNVIAAIQYIQRLNGYGRHILVHGVNLSVGYQFQPEWFACGESPLCVEVNRLVKSGVVVVVAAGNSGFGIVDTDFEGPMAAGLALTINDPGNAELAITVGSTHRDKPHTYGVSYFSSKGPTGDGRMKPDVLAPGEKIISCAANTSARRPASARRKKQPVSVGHYREDSGTSMAAPHVSGVIASFLSIRREFIGRPEEVKRIFLSTATDLRRVPAFQGHGLVDVMRAIQSI